MITVTDVCRVLENFAPINLQESYDNCGLLVGDYNTTICGVLLTTDVSIETVQEAKDLNCNMIVSHHPLIFSGIKRLTNQGYINPIIIDCIKNNIAIYAAHTNYDKVQGGVSYKMATKLSLQNIHTFIQSSADPNIGLGCIGTLEQAMPISSFFQVLKTTFGVKHIKHSQITSQQIVKKIALCGGSGAEFINNAIDAKADIYVTADISYHNYFLPNNTTVIADIGHYESEKFTKEIFYEQLTEIFPNFAFHISQNEKSPIFWD